jgi:hypothetical protein
MDLFTLASTALALFSFKETKEAGKLQQEQYDQAAADAKLQGRSAAIAYRQQGADILKDVAQTMATINANAAANGIEVSTGNPALLGEYAMAEAVSASYQSKKNADLEYAGLGAQSAVYAEAGRIARQTADTQAIVNLGQTVLKLYENR